MDKISDLVSPKPVEVPLLKGKKAIVGPFNMEVLCWVEEKYGSWDEFQDKHLQKNAAGNMRAITEFLFQLLENQDDFADVTEFRRCFDMSAIGKLLEAMNGQIGKSMIAEAPKKKKGAAADGGDDAGEKK